MRLVAGVLAAQEFASVLAGDESLSRFADLFHHTLDHAFRSARQHHGEDADAEQNAAENGDRLIQEGPGLSHHGLARIDEEQKVDGEGGGDAVCWYEHV